MFKKKNINSSDLEAKEKTKRTVVTETTETAEGVQTTRTTITTSTKDDFDAALKKFDFDPEKFRSGGSRVTKKVVYASSSGQKEVFEETVETYDEPPNTSANKVPKKNLIADLGFKTSKSPSSPKVKQTREINANSIKPGKFEEDCLIAHNAYRVQHGVPKLKLSKQLCAYAQEWADHLAAADAFQHREDRQYGENIFMKWSSESDHVVPGDEAVNSWYSEIKDHTFGREPRNSKSGHFTQVIWKESKEMGVSWSRSKKGKVLVVANYDPPGNFVGKFTENVPMPKK